MTKHSTSNLLLAAALSLPVFARAQAVSARSCRVFSGTMTAAQAKAAVTAAASEADANVHRLSALPIEFAGLSVAMPYGAEGPEICFGDGAVPQAVAALDRKAAYWNAVCDALVAERARNEAFAERASVEKIVTGARGAVLLDREVRACEAVALDAKEDVELVRKLLKSPGARETDEHILARKTKVFKQFGALKAAP